MRTLILLIGASFFVNEYFILNDELVLYMLAFLTQGLIVNSSTRSITELEENTTYSISNNYSKNLNEKEENLNNSYLNFLVEIGKISNISTSVQDASSNLVFGTKYNDLRSSIPSFIL